MAGGVPSEALARRRYGDGGFTLIELLLVIIVLGILAAIVVTAIGSLRRDSNEAVCRTQVHAVERAAEQFRAQHGAHPTTEADIAGPGAPLKSWPEASDCRLAWNTSSNEVDVYDLPQKREGGVGSRRVRITRLDVGTTDGAHC